MRAASCGPNLWRNRLKKLLILKDLKGGNKMDFCGFSFNGHHSSEMGFIRVSDGSRYNENLGAEFQDRTVAIPGGDGTYFFNSYYTQKPISINIAFDSMTETQLRTLREVFNAKDVGPLVFDESPYKAYIVKLQNPVQLKYICFDKESSYSTTVISDLYGPRAVEPTHERVYKGEGTINFIAYKPYAESRHLYLDDFMAAGTSDKMDLIAQNNMDEWKEASRMLQNSESFLSVATWSSAIEPNDTTNIWTIYNPGDISMGFKLYIDKSAIQSYPQFRIQESVMNNDATIESSIMNFDFSTVSDRLSADSSAELICINTKSELIEGCTLMHESTGFLYNDTIGAGALLKIPATDRPRKYSNVRIVTTTSGASADSIKINSVERNYLYY